MQVQYGSNQYWSERYQKQEGKTFDWLMDYSHLKPILTNHPYLSDKSKKWLNVGCGNGITNQQLYDDGYHHILNIDISHEVIQQMAQRNKQRQLMQFRQMDATQLNLSDCSFDVVFDKGTIDGVMCGDQYLLTAHRIIMEAYRVLKVDGMYVVVSYSQPSNRKYLFQRQSMDFSIEVLKVKTEDNTRYVYLCRKVSQFNEEKKKTNIIVEGELKKQLEEENQKIKKNGILFIPPVEEPKKQPIPMVIASTQLFDPFE